MKCFQAAVIRRRTRSSRSPDLGVPAAFWVGLERVHSAAKSFDRELWAEGREGSQRVWETLEECGDAGTMAFARDERAHFYAQLERHGEAANLKALDTLSTHIQWILISGGESMFATGGTRMLSSLTGSSGGPYAIPAGALLDTLNSPAVKARRLCVNVGKAASRICRSQAAAEATKEGLSLIALECL